jgi:hypothetical protein
MDWGVFFLTILPPWVLWQGDPEGWGCLGGGSCLGKGIRVPGVQDVPSGKVPFFVTKRSKACATVFLRTERRVLIVISVCNKRNYFVFKGCFTRKDR